MLIFRIFVIALVLRIILLTFWDILFSENDQFQVGNSNSNSYHTTSLLINHSVTHLKVFYSVFTSAFTNTIHYQDFEWTGRKGSLRNSIFFCFVVILGKQNQPESQRHISKNLQQSVQQSADCWKALRQFEFSLLSIWQHPLIFSTSIYSSGHEISEKPWRSHNGAILKRAAFLNVFFPFSKTMH